RANAVEQLESLGYATLAAQNGAEALALIEAGNHVDLLFTDVVMPGAMNGRQLGDHVRGRWPSVKVLYTSGYSEDAIGHHGRLDPDVLLLSKPYRKSDLDQVVRQALDATPHSAAMVVSHASVA